ncbi:adenine nucleotide alpha hydrolase [Sulfolobales archaeon HS-7]|nr:adenine nucleotide alpha hydrolase [Sulfolobales archaeon HS-7]
MICDKCKNKNAVVYQPHIRSNLCRECFINDIRERVKNELRQAGVNKNSKVLLAVSGGKDSYVLMDVLSDYFEPSNIIALNITEGINGYNRREHAEQLKRISKENGVDISFTSFKEEIGKSLDEIMVRNQSVSACTFCGGFRRKIINSTARNASADYVATGHNLDDEAQTVIINILRGDLIRLVRFGDLPLKVSDKFVTRIKPLRKIYEWETTMYSFLNGYKFQEVECPYISRRPTLRAKVRELLYSIEEEDPGALLKIVDNFDRIAEGLRKTISLDSNLPTCKICGEPTSYGRDICKNCELLLESGILQGELLRLNR